MGNSALLVPVIHRAKIANTQGLLFPTRAFGRPWKKKPEERVRVDQDSTLQLDEHVEKKQTSRRCEKRKRSTSEEEPKNSVSATENKGDTTKLTSPKRKMVSLKDFQKLFQRQHSINASKDKDEQVTDETAGGDKGEMAADRESAVDQSAKDTEEDKGRAEPDEDQVVLSLDENHNQLLGKRREDTNSCTNDNSGSTFKDEEEEGAASLPMKNHDEGNVDAVVSL